MEQLIFFLILIVIGYFAGTVTERNHYKSIRQREKQLLDLPVVTLRKIENEINIERAELVVGNVVISIDYFKKFLASLRNIFGGRVKAYETLVDRGRREAILRMKKMAGDADVIVNFRIETSSISKSTSKKNSVGCIEVLAYGTAIKYRQAGNEV